VNVLLKKLVEMKNEMKDECKIIDGQGFEFGHSDSDFGLSIKLNGVATLTQILICKYISMTITMQRPAQIRICVSVTMLFCLILSPNSESECPNSTPWPSSNNTHCRI
jgi:hypothetical protein